MLKRHEIQVLRRAGHTLKEVAKLTGVSQSSVQRVEAEPAVVTLVGAEPSASRSVGRPSKEALTDAQRSPGASREEYEPGLIGACAPADVSSGPQGLLRRSPLLPGGIQTRT